MVDAFYVRVNANIKINSRKKLFFSVFYKYSKGKVLVKLRDAKVPFLPYFVFIKRTNIGYYIYIKRFFFIVLIYINSFYALFAFF